MTLKHRMLVGLAWIAGAGLLFLAGHLQDPHLLPIRHLALPLLSGICLTGLLLWWRARRRGYAWIGALPLLLAILQDGTLAPATLQRSAERLAATFAAPK